MFDMRPIAQAILFTQFGVPKAGGTSQSVDIGDGVTLRIGRFRVGVKVQNAQGMKTFTGVVEEVELDDASALQLRKPDLQSGQLVDFSHDMIFACTRGV
jgi:hypothetical protein